MVKVEGVEHHWEGQPGGPILLLDRTATLLAGAVANLCYCSSSLLGHIIECGTQLAEFRST